MRPGGFVVLVLALILVLTAQVALIKERAHDFRDLGTPPGPAWQGQRCYRLGFDLANPHAPLPSFLKLSPGVALAYPHYPIWHRADTISGFTGPAPAYWRRAGLDSVDVHFPMNFRDIDYGLRFRLSVQGDTVTGRVEVTSDVGPWWLYELPTGNVVATRTDCAALPGGQRSPLKPPPNKRLKLPGGDRSNGSGVFAPWRTQAFVHCSCAGGRVARSLSAIR